MKKIILVMALVSMASIAYADQFVEGYTRQDGTYVAPHYRSTPDNSYNNNYNTQGNYNPYNGNEGTNRPTYNDKTPERNQSATPNIDYYGKTGYKPLFK